MALGYVMNNSLDNKFVIFSDSLSVLKSLNHTSSKNPKIQNLIEKHHELSKTKEILFCWLPSHVGIKGNRAADVKTKASLDLEISNFKLPCTDFKPSINRYILSKWQLSWTKFRKYYTYKGIHVRPALAALDGSYSKQGKKSDLICPTKKTSHNSHMSKDDQSVKIMNNTETVLPYVMLEISQLKQH